MQSRPDGLENERLPGPASGSTDVLRQTFSETSPRHFVNDRI